MAPFGGQPGRAAPPAGAAVLPQALWCAAVQDTWLLSCPLLAAAYAYARPRREVGQGWFGGSSGAFFHAAMWVSAPLSHGRYGHFSGINRKVQLTYLPHGRPKASSEDEGKCLAVERGWSLSPQGGGTLSLPGDGCAAPVPRRHLPNGGGRGLLGTILGSRGYV